jgi:glycosyltransferase 2 family protein
LGEKKTRSTRARLLLLITNLISIGSLIWTLRDAQLSELKDDLATMNWWWVGVAVIFDLGVYLWHAIRWRLLLRPVLRLGFGRTVRSIYVGLFANEVLPFRVGEVIRCYLLSSGTKLPFSVSLTSALIERVFDGVWLCVCLFAMLQFTPIPRSLRFLVDGGYVLVFVVLALALVLGFAMFRRHETRAAFSGKRWQKQFHVLIDDLELIGHSRYLLLSFIQSLPYLLLSTVPIYASMMGYGFDLSLGSAFALMVILRLGSVVPQAPGNLGVFQFLVRTGLEKLFNVVPAEAARFSLVLWGIVTLPLLIGGFVALAVTGTKLGAIHLAAQNEADTLSKRQ